MLVIRFFRVGKRNQPSFKIVVTDKRRASRGGRFVQELGFWNPLTKEKVLRKERVKYWLSKGAQPSDTVHNLLVTEKILEGKKIPLHKIKKRKEKETGKTEATKTQEPKLEEVKKDDTKERAVETKTEISKKTEEEAKETVNKEEVKTGETPKEAPKEETPKEEKSSEPSPRP